jgi:nucleoside-diphosphate-sugar epimerase
VACLVRPTSDLSRLEKLGVEQRVGSLSDEASLAAALEGIHAVYHLAGLTHGRRLEDFLRVNAEGAESLCRAAASQPSPPTVLLVSSLAAVGPSPPGRPHDEATPPEPVSNYGRSKLAGERAARGFADRLPLTIVRPPVVFGPGDRDGLLLFKALRRFPLHAVPQLRGLPLSLIYVDDLVEAMVAVAERGERVTQGTDAGDPRGVYFAADPAASSYADMGRMAGEALGRKVYYAFNSAPVGTPKSQIARVWNAIPVIFDCITARGMLVLCRRKYPFIPLALAGDLIGAVTGKPPIFGSDKLREASASGWVCTPQKAITTLNWAPVAPLVQRYQQTFDWYREAGWLLG